MAVQIYHTRLRPESACLPASWLDELPPAKRAELERCHPIRRQESAVGLQLLAYAMGRSGRVDFDLGTLDLTPGRKPRELVPGAAERRPLDFSISHTRGLAACALSLDPDLAVGLDVERERPLGPGILGKLLTPEAGPALEQWTRREAVVKAAGSAGLARLREVELDGDARASLDGRPWRLQPLDLGPGFVAHLATPLRAFGSAPQVTVRQVSWSDLSERSPSSPTCAP